MARKPVAVQQPLSIMTNRALTPATLPKLQMLTPAVPSPARRKPRKPRHEAYLVTRPWDIQMAALVPIFPGDTLQNMLLQVRGVTDPIRNGIMGWWNEYALYYVKHTDLGTGDQDPGTAETTANAIRDMHLTNAALGLADATERLHNYKVGTDSVVDWGHLCMQQIVRWYHRDGEESIDGYHSGGVRNTTLYKARVRQPMWMDSLKVEDVNPASQGDLAIGEQFNDVFVPTAFQTHYDQWEYMRQIKLLPDTVSFDDYLKSWGVSVPAEEKEVINRPELIRYIREWQYPSNTIDPTDGSAASAVSWGIQARADKARYFKEPGFLVLVNVVRPKVYFGNQIRTASTMLDDAYAWAPAILSADPYVTLVEYDHNEGPISGIPNSADDYWVDRRDLFIYGDQFVNFDPRDANATCNIVDLPSSSGDNNLQRWYASATDCLNLFNDSDDSEGLTKIRQDLVCEFHIMSAPHVSTDQT